MSEDEALLRIVKEAQDELDDQGYSELDGLAQIPKWAISLSTP